MQRPLTFPQKSFGLILASFIFLCGFSALPVKDIQTAIMEQDYEQAEKLAESFVATHPEKTQLIEAQYYLGLAKLNLGKYAESRGIFERILAKKPDKSFSDRAALGIIDSFMLEGSYEKALQNSQKLLQENPQSEFLSLIYFKMARAHYKLAHWDEATQVLNQILDQYPDSPEAHLAKQLLAEKHYFAVQVGSFLDQDLAEKMMKDLRNKDSHAYAYIVEMLDKNGQKFFRVRIGQFSRLDQALSMAKKLSQLGYPTLIYP